MKTKSRWISLFLAMVMMVLFASLAFRMRLPAPSATQLIRGESGKAAIMETYGKLPMYFEANAGQTEEQAKFIARGTGYTLFLTPQEAVLSLRKPTPSAIRMQLVGANRAPEVQGLEELPSHVNYFIGQDSTKWQTGIPTYSRVRYQAVYPGVDLVYYGNQRQLEYDFIVAPGVDPSVIKLGFAGAEKLGVNGAGELVLKLAGEEVRMRKPVLYQERNGQREEIAGSYTLACATDAAGNLPQVGFHVGAYDATRPMAGWSAQR